MALQFSTSVRNAMLDSIETTIGTTAHVVLFAGTKPADCATANAGTVIATFSLTGGAGDWMAAAGSGSKAFNNTPLSTTASSAGTPTYFRVFNNNAGSPGTTCHWQGGVGTTANSTVDLTLDNTTVTSGQTIQITSWTVTAPGA